MADDDLEKARLELERSKHEDDVRLRERDAALREQQERRAGWHSPVFIAVAAGVIGIVGNAVVASINGTSQRALEREKSEAALVLQALKTGNPDFAAYNLKLLADAKLVTGQREAGIRGYLNKREPGEGARLPVASGLLDPDQIGRKLNIIFANRYPKFAVWLSSEFPKVKDNQKVWQAFLKHAQLSQQKAERVLVGSSPQIWVRDLGAVLGYFDPAASGRIVLGSELLRRFEAQSEDPAAQRFMEAALLHEHVHWSFYDRGDPEPQNVEVGREFEKEAYGALVEPFWRTGTANKPRQ